jgi:hypothetical protein
MLINKIPNLYYITIFVRNEIKNLNIFSFDKVVDSMLTSTRVRASVMMIEAVGDVQRGTTALAEKIRDILLV